SSCHQRVLSVAPAAGPGAARAATRKRCPLGDLADRSFLQIGVRIDLELQGRAGQPFALPRSHPRAAAQKKREQPGNKQPPHQKRTLKPISPNTLLRSESSAKPG